MTSLTNLSLSNGPWKKLFFERAQHSWMLRLERWYLEDRKWYGSAVDTDVSLAACSKAVWCRAKNTIRNITDELRSTLGI